MPVKTHFVGWILAVVMAYIGCSNEQERGYEVISYLDINVDSLGNLPVNPYMLQIQNGEKSLLVIGTQHSRDTLHPMFDTIEQAFFRFKPEIVINEGGHLTKTYPTRNKAIQVAGELGLEKYLADQANIKTYSGDAPFVFEFAELSKAYSREEALVFFASERFVFPYAFGHYEGDITSSYQQHFIEKYFINNHIKLTAEEKTFEFYTQCYARYFQTVFSLDTINQLDFSPFSQRHHFCAVTRKSKELRDDFLLREIETQLKTHHRVMVIYGGWHVLAIEPALQQIMARSLL